MKILIDIVHPADVLFFFHPIRRWRQMGHEIQVASRRKDVTGELLDAFGIEHRVLSAAGRSLPALAVEMLRRDLAMLKLARRFRPDIMTGFGGVAISHVGKVLGIPSVSFYDTGRAPLQHRVTLPFISHLHVTESYDGPIARDRTDRFPGTKDFSYLHPDNFLPDRAAAVTAGLAEQGRNYFIRLVGWEANHDVGHAGWNAETLAHFVHYLGEQGKVHISSELPLPTKLEKHRYRGAVDQLHHLLAFCTCYIGESATMAGEAALLGVPAIYATRDRRCYTDELTAVGLLLQVHRVDYQSLHKAVCDAAALDRTVLAQRLATYMAGKINLADYVVEAVFRQVGQGELSR